MISSTATLLSHLCRHCHPASRSLPLHLNERAQGAEVDDKYEIPNFNYVSAPVKTLLIPIFLYSFIFTVINFDVSGAKMTDLQHFH